MALCLEWEIYIPVEAEVKIVPLKILPNSLLRRIGLHLPDWDADRPLADSPDVIWMCPAVISKKGQGSAARRATCSVENTRLFLNTYFQGGAAPLKMPFVSSNRQALEVLKSISPGKCFSKVQLCRQDAAPLANQNAVVIYNGQVYLCIRKAARTQRLNKKQERRPTSGSAAPSASALPSNHPKKELVADGLEGKNYDVVSTISPAPDTPAPVDLTEPPSGGGAPPRQESSSHSGAGRYEMHELADEDCSAWTAQPQTDSQGAEEGGSWGPAESAGAALLRTEFDFNELAQEENIAQLKAKLLESEAALDLFS